MQSSLASLILSICKRIMKIVIAIDSSKVKKVYYTVTDSMYLENKYWSNLEEKDLVRKKIGQGKVIRTIVVQFMLGFLNQK